MLDCCCALQVASPLATGACDGQSADLRFVLLLASLLLLQRPLCLFPPCFCAWLERERAHPVVARAGHSSCSPSRGGEERWSAVTEAESSGGEGREAG